MHESDIKIRLANPSDLEYANQRGYLPEEVVLRKIEMGEVFLLIIDTQPAGLINLEFLWSVIPYIALIWIDETHRKKGYSWVLLSFVEDHLRAKGYKTLYSSSQANEAEPQAWHRHMGFEECGILNGVNEDGIGEIFFKKAL